MRCSLIMWSVHAVTQPLALLSLVILQLRFRRSTVTPGEEVKAPPGKPWCASWCSCAFHVNRTKRISQWVQYLHLLFIAEQFTAWRAEPVFICSVIPEHMCPTLD